MTCRTIKIVADKSSGNCATRFERVSTPPTDAPITIMSWPLVPSSRVGNVRDGHWSLPCAAMTVTVYTCLARYLLLAVFSKWSLLSQNERRAGCPGEPAGDNFKEEGALEA